MNVTINQVPYFFPRYRANQAGNPFSIPCMDIRGFTQTVHAHFSETALEEKFTQLRDSDGSEYRYKRPENAVIYPIQLSYLHDGSELEGMLFQSDCKEYKWDIYVYDRIIYFVQSWTGILSYCAHIVLNENSLEIVQIECSQDEDAVIALNNIHFLIISHALGIDFPHYVPPDLKESPEDSALYSFAIFGKMACFVSHESIISAKLRD